MGDKLRVGLIGTGRIGLVHAISINENKDCELTYVADVFIDGAKKISDQFGGKVTADPRELINSGEVDAIVIGSPTPTHLELLDAAIDAGVHALCEKPIDLDIQKVDAMLPKASAAKINISLGFNRRFDPNFEAIHDRVKAGELGTLEQLIISSRDPGPAPREYIAVSGGIFRDMTIHDFDMARYFVPEIVEVTARGANTFCDYIKDENDYDSVNVIMRGRNDELITIINSRHAAYGYDQRLEAFGEKGMLVASNLAKTTVRSYTANHTEQRDPYMEFFLERYAISYRRELALFVESVQTGKQLNPSYQDGREALFLAEAALESAKTGKTITL
jgi:myo-inositol 2-dehydrogenase/D-chiro-inositol 1-dehydrogenase